MYAIVKEAEEMTKKIKVALYSRVSTDGQNLDGPETEMKEDVKHRGWEVTRIYRDKMSGAKSSRPTGCRSASE